MLRGAYCLRQMYGHSHYKKFWLKKMEETHDEQTQDSLRTVQPEAFGSRIFWHSNEIFRSSLEIKGRIKSTIRVSSVRSGAESNICELKLEDSEEDLPDGSQIDRALSIGMQMQMPYDADPRIKLRRSVIIDPLQEVGDEDEKKLQENRKKSSAKESPQSLRRFLQIGENHSDKTGATDAEFPDRAVARTCAECKTDRTEKWPGRTKGFRCILQNSNTPVPVNYRAMSVAELRERHVAATAKVNALRERIKDKRRQLLDTDVATYASTNGRTPISFSFTDLVCCRTLQGHTGKVYSLDWTSEKNRIVSASQDGRLIVWNALTSQKTHAIKLPCAWVMTCAFSPSGQAVACGGLDSVCSIFQLNSQFDRDGHLPVSRILSGHRGYVSSCQYVPDGDTHVITGSGDRTCVQWDVTTGQRIAIFGGEFPLGHTADVMSVSISAANPKEFVSGSCDTTTRLWDTRIASRAIRTFHGHEADVNTVKFFPDGLRFGTGSDDGTCRLFDIRTGHQLQVYRQPPRENQTPTVTSIAFSFSGRLLFAGYSNGDCFVWDTILEKVVLNLGELQNTHNNRISCLGLSADGSALCTGSWDKNLKIWAFGGHRRIA